MTKFVINLRQMIMNIKSVEMKKWMWCFHTSMLWHSCSKQKLHIFFLLSLRSWREWVRARNFAAKPRANSSRDLRGFLHSRSGPKFARVPTPAGYAGYFLLCSSVFYCAST